MTTARRGLLTLVLTAAAIVAGCSSSTTPPSASGPLRTGITGRATAGPMCPVEQPGDPACDPRPVANAEIVVQDLAGAEVARTRTNADGTFSVPVPPGDYVVVGLAAEGLMGVPEPSRVTVTDGQVTTVDLAYDTGIR